MRSDRQTKNTAMKLLKIAALYVIVIGFISIALELAQSGNTFFSRNASFLAAAIFLYLPLIIIFIERGNPIDYGFGLGNIKSGILLYLLAMLICYPPFIYGVFLWQRYIVGAEISPGIPPNFSALVITQFIIVALPEEAFYRGYFQSRLDHLFVQRWCIFGTKFGLGLFLASFLFALGHVIVRGNILLINVFFPGVIFGFMRARTGSIAAGVALHATSNLLVVTLLAK
jgi:membrane protease YdiL (CAAX protease family)